MNKIIKFGEDVGDYKVFQDKDGTEYICCPNAPDCDGTLIDWFDADSK